MKSERSEDSSNTKTNIKLGEIDGEAMR